MIRHAWRLGVVVTAFALIVPSAVSAHADLVSSDPADGATVEGPFIGPITLTFDEALHEGSGAELTLPSGEGLAAGPDANDPTTIAIALEAALPAGTYEVRWTSASEDGDIERGTITFTVGAPSPTPTPTATPPPDGGGSGIVGTETILVILAALALVGVLAFRFLRRGAAAR